MTLRFAIPIAAALAGALLPGSAAGQEDYRAIVTAMRACIDITDVVARAACYDAGIRPQGNGAVTRAGQAQIQAAAPAGYGADALPRQRSREEREDAAQLTVTRATEREPGIYLLTLEDGGEWLLVDPAPPAYDPPGRGDTVSLERSAMGGFSMRYDGQRSLRIRRVR